MQTNTVTNSPLGKENIYISTYQPNLLFPIPRQNTRGELGIDPLQLPFKGVDIWNAFELSWLNPQGKPIVACAEFTLPCTTPRLIESKSFKLYLNSFNNTKFASWLEVETTLIQDLSNAAGAKVNVKLIALAELPKQLHLLSGVCLDELAIECGTYHIEPNTLKTLDEDVEETLYSHLLKSNCPVTGQPDWASVSIRYQGKKIEREGLLKYIVSYRDHNGFHEDCVERIFMDIQERCTPQQLVVFARYTRRGGLDINPYRASYDLTIENHRLLRQ